MFSSSCRHLARALPGVNLFLWAINIACTYYLFVCWASPVRASPAVRTMAVRLLELSQSSYFPLAELLFSNCRVAGLCAKTVRNRKPWKWCHCTGPNSIVRRLSLTPSSYSLLHILPQLYPALLLLSIFFLFLLLLIAFNSLAPSPPWQRGQLRPIEPLAWNDYLCKLIYL